MPDIHALFAHYAPLLVTFLMLAMKVGVPLGVFGSFVERVGLSLATRAPRLSARLVEAGKLVEAVSVDVPKLATNALSALRAVGRFLGITLGLLALLYFSQACAQQAVPQAQLAAVTAGCKAGQAIDDDAGAAGARDALDEGCAKTIRVWMRGGAQ